MKPIPIEAPEVPPTVYRTCPLCEATCGLQIEHTRKGPRVKGDREDPLSRGYLCPKGAALLRSDDDPDRLTLPLVRDRKSGRRHEVSWSEAFSRIEEGLSGVVHGSDPDALAFYYGSGIAHTISNFYYSTLSSAVPTRNLFGSSTVDQAPKQVSSSLMFGHPMTVPIPDIDHSEYLLILGANPVQSNGSLFTAPGLGGRIRRLRQRGGRVVVVDPRFTETAEIADEHVAIRPATDAYFLAALIHVLLTEDLVGLGRLERHVNGMQRLAENFRPFSPEAVGPRCGMKPSTMRRLAREVAQAPSAAVYGRIGTTTQEFGTVSSWMIDLVNVLTGNLDRRGGVMFPLAAVGQANSRLTTRNGVHELFGPPTRVSGAPSINIVRGFERPAVCIAEEMETRGKGQIRALITIGCNPVLTRPNSRRLENALGDLDFMVSVDPYLNETTAHADVVLPSPPDLAKEHYPATYMQWSTRNQARWTPRSRPLREHEMCDTEIYLRLANVLLGRGAQADPWELDQEVVEKLVTDAVTTEHHRLFGRDPDDILRRLGPRSGVSRVVDFLLRSGPYGDKLDDATDGLTLETLEQNPHGIDLGPLERRVPEILATRSGKIELAPDLLIEDLTRLRNNLDTDDEGLILIGRRHLKSNNSWMHNVDILMRGDGPRRCTMQIHPDDASACNVDDGATAIVRNEHGEIAVRTEVTTSIMQGVVSIPHGFGHDVADTRLARATQSPGANVNVLIPDDVYEPLSGNAVLSGIRVFVTSA